MKYISNVGDDEELERGDIVHFGYNSPNANGGVMNRVGYVVSKHKGVTTDTKDNPTYVVQSQRDKYKIDTNMRNVTKNNSKVNGSTRRFEVMRNELSLGEFTLDVAGRVFLSEGYKNAVVVVRDLDGLDLKRATAGNTGKVYVGREHANNEVELVLVDFDEEIHTAPF